MAHLEVSPAEAVAGAAQSTGRLLPGDERAFLTSLMHAALRAADPLIVLPPHVPPKPSGRTVVVGAGKAAARMALAFEQSWSGPLSGLVITRYGHGCPCRQIEVVEAGHPVPDAAGESAARRMLATVRSLGADDLVVALLSGGGSSLLAAPIAGIDLRDKQALTRALLLSGATIAEINRVRKHLSDVKGGKLAAACGPASLLTLLISDVPGDNPATVASGPTLDDGSTPADALEILARYGIECPARIEEILRRAPWPSIGAASPGPRQIKVIATAQTALDNAALQARARGVTPVVLGNAIEGEARHVGSVHAAIARQIRDHDQPARPPAVILSGGETTVKVAGSGRGGRNAEFLLAQLGNLRGCPGIWGLAIDTDGIDGSEANAGAIFGPESWAQAQAMGWSAERVLAENDAYSYFEALGDLITTGPTGTNVNDFRATLIL
jgi:glycerate 2-kinase